MASVFTFISAAALGVFALSPALALEASAAPAQQSIGAVHMSGDNNSSGAGTGNSGGSSGGSAGSSGSNTGSGHN